MRILLIEDDVTLGKITKEYLYKKGYTIDWLKDGESAQFALQKELFDLALLDLGLPKILGLDLLQTIRNQGITLPVIITTARDSLQDKIEGLDSGADDFLAKPFKLDELEARIRACLRRVSGHAEMILQVDNIALNPVSHIVTVDGLPVRLPRREFAVLHKLLENKGQVVPHERLIQSVYGWAGNISSNVLEVHIHNLRRKLKTSHIRTVRGVGYFIEKEIKIKDNQAVLNTMRQYAVKKHVEMTSQHAVVEQA